MPRTYSKSIEVKEPKGNFKPFYQEGSLRLIALQSLQQGVTWWELMDIVEGFEKKRKRIRDDADGKAARARSLLRIYREVGGYGTLVEKHNGIEKIFVLTPDEWHARYDPNIHFNDYSEHKLTMQAA